MKLRGYLTRRASGLYLLTYYPAVIAEIGRTDRRDAYAAPGDPLAVNNLCEWSADRLWGVKDLEPLTSVRVVFHGSIEN